METHRDEDRLADLSSLDFDRVALIGRISGDTQDAWHRTQAVDDVVNDAPPALLDRHTLFVHVDDEADEPTAERVRLALGLPADQLYAA
jgi:hypothetical protein